MGDMADFANDDRMDETIDLYEHRDNGFPTDQNAYENGFVDELGRETFSEESFNIPSSSMFNRPFASVPLVPARFRLTCKHCGFTPLRWLETDNGWRLGHKDGEIHECEEFFNQGE